MSQSPGRRSVHAVAVGRRVNVRPLMQATLLSSTPVALEVNGGGFAVEFRFGVVVFIDVAPTGQSAFIGSLQGHIIDPVEQGEFETLEADSLRSLA